MTTGIWPAIRVERASLVADLSDLTPEQWATHSLCTDWTIEETVAHLSAAASVGRLRWFRSAIGARFDFALHNRRRLDEQLGATPAETLAILRSKIDSTVRPMGDERAWLGEVVVHGADIRRPLGLPPTTPLSASTAVAEFYASRDFAVPSRTTAAGLRLVADDGPFTAGSDDDPLVTGPTLALVLAMAGRAAFCDELSGPGVATLRDRCSAQ
ncbi:maleylpyruvate isomerase family mycothiol-dependent enzyme [Actinomycetospora endophytica]|uniref:Maleylpyruvate isomerase family mycothiol-dependent enzyme n=1 Tax=Actinomycetospora endophytica TaxID=2291215 RepID=A0ABS8P4K9_9PSEU|nr:maleylpyruvate isomerase family mycothiol-dependent enzyme [Actinomycetospora endophytica]MCD2192485.1 maleylpyruvate isomerase family mycothiol-dependent enzyme [Actinomycetospora endophytica]